MVVLHLPPFFSYSDVAVLTQGLWGHGQAGRESPLRLDWKLALVSQITQHITLWCILEQGFCSALCCRDFILDRMIKHSLILSAAQTLIGKALTMSGVFDSKLGVQSLPHILCNPMLHSLKLCNYKI